MEFNSSCFFSYLKKGLLIFGSMLFTILAQSQISEVYHEIYYTHDGISTAPIPEGYKTYRIYAELNTPSDRITAVFSDVGYPDIYIRANNDIWQSQYGSALEPNIEWPFDSNIEFDSYVNLYTGQGTLGNPISLIPVNAFDNFESGLDLNISDGGWFAVGLNSFDYYPSAVLIAQITTSQPLSYCLNFAVTDGFQYTTQTDFCFGIFGCTDPEACNYNPNATTDNGNCNYLFGCTDVEADNYDQDALCDDGSCFITGCTDSEACNFNPNATIESGDCNFLFGCTDVNADNYDITALCDDGNCIFLGCTDPQACNFDPEANTDDGTCLTNYGCTDPTALNYDPLFVCEDGSCIYEFGCTDPIALNFDPAVLNNDGSCIYTLGTGCDLAFTKEISTEETFLYDVNVDFSEFDNLSLVWDFGDGSTTNQHFPMHIYTEDGSFNLCLYNFRYGTDNELECMSQYCEIVSSDDFPAFTEEGLEIFPFAGFRVNVNDIHINTNEQELIELSLFPNPSSQGSWLALPPGIWEIDIYDTQGRLVDFIPNASRTIFLNTENWLSGSYIIQTRNERENPQAKRLIVR